MSYHIIEERKLDKDGNYVPPSKFFVVDRIGKRIGPFDDFLSANHKLQELEAEKNRTKGTEHER